MKKTAKTIVAIATLIAVDGGRNVGGMSREDARVEMEMPLKMGWNTSDISDAELTYAMVTYHNYELLVMERASAMGEAEFHDVVLKANGRETYLVFDEDRDGYYGIVAKEF